MCRRSRPGPASRTTLRFHPSREPPHEFAGLGAPHVVGLPARVDQPPRQPAPLPFLQDALAHVLEWLTARTLARQCVGERSVDLAQPAEQSRVATMEPRLLDQMIE